DSSSADFGRTRIHLDCCRDAISRHLSKDPPLVNGTVIITGVAGFIGTSLASRVLAAPGSHVVGIDDLSRRGAAENLAYLDRFGSRLSFHRGDIRDRTFVEDVVGRHADADAIVHLAGQT